MSHYLQDVRQKVLPRGKADCVHHVNLQKDHQHVSMPVKIEPKFQLVIINVHQKIKNEINQTKVMDKSTREILSVHVNRKK